jgi:transketolase
MNIPLSSEDLSHLQNTARTVRARVLTVASQSGACHIGSSLSPIDLLVALYFRVMHIDPTHPADPQRDRCILSKGHGALGLYATLEARGYFPASYLDQYGKDNSILSVHPVYQSAPGIEATSGALGHGLSMGLGLALASHHDAAPWNTYVVMSDGECDEGSIWEAAMLAGHLHVNNLVALVDYNKIQSFGMTKDILDLEPFTTKWESMGWEVREVNGHNYTEIVAALETPREQNKPLVIIAHTVKGKGVSYMENTLDWHYKNLKPEDLPAAIAEL